MKCNLCPRRCNAERTLNSNHGGYCKMPLRPFIARAALHKWEEPCISGNMGSGTVFFSGCSLSCVFCQNYDVSHRAFGKPVTEEELSEIFLFLERAGAHNINLVTPTHYSLCIKKALDIYRPKIPIVYNCGGYENPETLRSLEKYVDIYLMDFKYISSRKAAAYSNAEDYPEVAKAALFEAYRQKSRCVFDESGIMKSGVIVRHLLMPQATNDAIRIFDFVRENTENVYFSLMSQYIPCGEAASMPPIDRKITAREYEKVVDYILNSGFQNCYIQDRSSASTEFIPDFNF